MYVNSYLGLHCSETAGNFFLVKVSCAEAGYFASRVEAFFAGTKKEILRPIRTQNLGPDNGHHNAHCEIPCSSC